jgi:3-hydroxybutyryl-CoA dehydrogenase
MSVERVFVAGAGLMGHGIGQAFAASGRAVVLYEPELARADAGRERIAGNLARSVEKGRLDAEDRDATLARIAATDDVGRAAEADLVVEAVFEDIEVKRGLWRVIDGVAPEGALFASNTSSIAIDRLAGAVGDARRPRFVGMHFFSPVPVMPLVELVRGSATSDETANAITALAGDLGKQVIVSTDRPGFIVNRMLMPFLAEAMRAYQEGVGTAEDIDTGARVGLNHPMGPLELADFIGLDVCRNIMLVIADGLGRDNFRPPRVLDELVQAGNLGQKSGQGFYTYPREPARRADEPPDRGADEAPDRGGDEAPVRGDEAPDRGRDGGGDR